MEYSDTYGIEVYSSLLSERFEPRRAVLRVMISRIQPWDLQSAHGDVVYDCRFFFRSSELCQPDGARAAISGMLNAVGVPVPEEDLESIGDAIAPEAAMLAAEARLLGRGPYIVAHIRIYLREPWWVFEPEDDSDIPASASTPWQHLQEAAAAIDDVLVLDEGDLGSRRGFGGTPALSSAVKNLDRMSYDGEARNWCREEACVICTEDFEQGAALCRMPCCHVFHEGCLVRWLNQSRVCPLCRFSL